MFVSSRTYDCGFSPLLLILILCQNHRFSRLLLPLMAEVFSVFVALDLKVNMRRGNLKLGILKFFAVV